MTTTTKIVLGLLGVGAAVGVAAIARNPELGLRERVMDAGKAIGEWADPIVAEVIKAQAEARERLQKEYATVASEAKDQLGTLRDKLPEALQPS